MFLLRGWRWLTPLNCEMLCSPDTLQVLLTKLTSMAESMTSESMVRGLPDLARSLRFLQLKKQNFFYTTNVFGWFQGDMAKFELVKHKFPKEIMLCVHLCNFQILNRMKQCTYQSTNYHHITNHSLNCFGHKVFFLPNPSMSRMW